jgi:hypothetical protein
MDEGEEEGGGWAWHPMAVENLDHRGKDIWRHPACRVTTDRVVVLGKSRVTAAEKSTKDLVNQVNTYCRYQRWALSIKLSINRYGNYRILKTLSNYRFTKIIVLSVSNH